MVGPEREREREVIVTDGGGGGGGAAAAVAAIVGIIVVLVLVWAMFLRGEPREGTPTDIPTVDVTAPVDDGGDTGGGGDS